ncbi:MAG TPA: transglutaminaseTgpA domain-containing protein [Anaerolineales bacterium]|nr:transglutaminaseTgpA domain-containing protein [Anaerolineales bacterium]
MEKTSVRNWDWISNLIMLFAVLFSAWRLQTADWTEGLGQVRNVAVLGFALGLGVGYSQFKRKPIFFLVAGYTVAILIWQLLGTIPFNKDQTYLLDKFSILFGRMFTSLGELFAGRAVEDQFFVVALLCIPYWFASLYSGFQLTRRSNFLGTILPNGVLMLIIHLYHYTNQDYTWMLGVYLFLALLLLSRLKYLADRRKWSKERIQVQSDSGLDITNTTVAVATVLILLAWGSPYILPATTEGKQIWREVYGQIFPKDRFKNVFASVEKENQPKARNFRPELALGTQTPQGNSIVFQVYVPLEAKKFPRLYWRGQVYDRYENGRWLTTSDAEVRQNPATGDITIPDSADRQRLSFTFDVMTSGQTTVYLPPQPIWINHNTILLSSDISNKTGEDAILDIMAVRASPPFQDGDLYRVSSLLADPTAEELRLSGDAYPDWVKEKYLQLPENFSPRIQALAQQITAPYNTPYDKTVAVTNYLRREIEYTGVIYLPNEDVDPLEYVLFDAKRAFCNYYATAQVLMLRSVGIPARLAVGYAQGQPNIQKSLYAVREKDLHAWPEVYFPEYGWIEFEPTTNQQPIERPEAREDLAQIAPFANNSNQPLFKPDVEFTPDQEPNVPDGGSASARSWLDWLASLLPWLGGVFFILLGIVLKRRFAPQVTVASVMKRAIDRSGWNAPRWLRRWLAFATQPAIQRHFHNINISLRLLKRPQPVHVTAAERAQTLKGLLPSASASIDSLLNELQAELFTPNGGNEAIARRAAWDILSKTVQSKLKIIILGYNYEGIKETS